MKKLFFFPLIAGMFFCAIPSALAQGDGLTFSIKMNKSTYSRGEAISCFMTLKNVSGKGMVINKRMLVNQPMGPREVSLMIIGPDLKQVPFRLKIDANFTTTDYGVLPNGQSLNVRYSLKGRFDCSAPGKYSIRAYYENKYDAPAASGLAGAWKGQLVSSQENFTIQ